MAVDPGFAQAVRRHVEEDGSLVRQVAAVGDSALWGPQTIGQWTPVRLREVRKRSLAQARELLLPPESAVDRGNELCQAHGAYAPEGDCFVCDTQQAKERALAAEASLLWQRFRIPPLDDLNVDDLATWSGLSREAVEEAVERLEDDGRIVAVVKGADRPHWRLERREGS